MKKLSILAAMMVVAAGVAFASTLNVPFFLDTSVDHAVANSGIAGFIGVKETSGSPQTLTVIYTQLNASGTPVDQQVTFALGASQSVSWTPITNNVYEDTGSVVGNMVAIVGPNNGDINTAGSAQIRSAGTLVGRYQQINTNRGTEFAHTLLPTAL